MPSSQPCPHNKNKNMITHAKRYIFLQFSTVLLWTLWYLTTSMAHTGRVTMPGSNGSDLSLPSLEDWSKIVQKVPTKANPRQSAGCFHLSKEPWVVLTLDYPTTTANWAALYEFEEKPTLDVRRQPVLREVVSLEKKSET